MGNGNKFSIWRWVLAVGVVVALFAPAAVASSGGQREACWEFVLGPEPLPTILPGEW